ncbi:MAG: pseudouridine synthase [Saprospiraceae bacterium]|jgi:23S rRNA pseudouridine2605 synthase
MEKQSDAEGQPAGIRINKYLAQAGLCSRRKADEYVSNGLVTINGEVIKQPGTLVLPGDEVTLRGRKVEQKEPPVYLLLNKPKNTICTASDPQGRMTVLDIVSKKIRERVFPVGRLDRDTTGLLVLTNDGSLAERLAHPRHQVKKVYHVVLDKPVSETHLRAIKNGLTLEDGPAQVDSVAYVEGKETNEVGIELHIGRNRIVRRIFEHLGYRVVRLDRVYYGGLTKKDLPRGRFRHLTDQEVIMLKHFS